MMKCLVCQKELSDQAVFCTGCGQRVPRCPTCNMPLTKRVAFCTNDGTRIPEDILELFPESMQPQEQPPKYFCTQCGGPCGAEQRICDICLAKQGNKKKKQKEKRGPGRIILSLLLLLILLGLGGTGIYAVTNDLIDLPVLKDINIFEIFDKDVSDKEMDDQEKFEEGKEDNSDEGQEDNFEEEKEHTPDVEAPVTESPTEEIPDTQAPVEDPMTLLNVGDVLYFGTYEQDNRAENGEEPIEWIVLEKTDEGLLVITKYALERIQFHTSMDEITWEDSYLRNWLNTTFYSTAFTAEEQSRILSVKVSAHNNPNYDNDPGNDTQDKVYILSTMEAAKYFPTKKSRLCYPTEYVKSDELLWLDSSGSVWWWLRTRGELLTDATSVNTDGAIDFKDGKVDATSGTVRPVMWIRIE